MPDSSRSANVVNFPPLSELLSQLTLDEGEGRSEKDERDKALDSSEESPFNIKNFEAFLLRSHCAENFEFWKDCNYYLANYHREDFDYKGWNKKIYENFIQENSSMECNLPDRMRKLFGEWYRSETIADRDAVLRAKQHAIDLMSDAYRHFVRSVNTSYSVPASNSVSTSSVYTSTTTSTEKAESDATIEAAKRAEVRRTETSSQSNREVCSLKTKSKKVSRSADSLSSLAAFSSQDSDTEGRTTGSKDIMRSNSSGSYNFFDKGLALMTKLKKKKVRPKLNSPPSASGDEPSFYLHLKQSAINRTSNE
ncbi:hypothetical protein HG535_0A02890 [Zygotorulaspora mrakii]|uniref:RGS domain-containing protein n=1 Tax=Zygotorulaspora mrakii TaxID=42260 RepID=A0A7H9AVG6_ZYGMR|nr:uncharacterized protein HG535_0A02890 [Zygotorulaspora mrakii]QLG70350.1 hypothetical protein HG535_0A02890 [Zygotorulaspora mrakii]